ncbi:MAG: cytochrome c biogenesis protein CcsA [Chloroflexi bacterium]|nr:cytochrome c biogenesis protein CcsA [Chloroflexota bacterium]
MAVIGVSFLLMVASLFMALLYAPTERFMGDVQRIFYFHVPLAWLAFLNFFIVFVASIQFLRKGSAAWDQLAYCAAEIGTLFTTLVLITGSLWAKPVWGTWWSWDPRLTASLILWLIYIAYLTVRSYAAESGRGTRFAAVVGILGFVDVPIVYLSIYWWRTLHPGPVIQTGGMVPEMTRALLVSLLAFTVFFVILMRYRLRLRRMETEIEELRQADR